MIITKHTKCPACQSPNTSVGYFMLYCYNCWGGPFPTPTDECKVVVVGSFTNMVRVAENLADMTKDLVIP